MMVSSEQTGNRGWVFLQVLCVVMAWQLLQFAGGVFTFVSVWPKVAASHEAFGMAGMREQLVWRHAGVLVRAYAPAGMLVVLAVYPLVVMWLGCSGRFWAVVWRTLLLVLLLTLLVSAAVVHYRPWMVSGMDGRHWYFRVQEALPGWVRQGVLPFVLKGTVVAWLAFSGGWYCYRFVCWLRSGWTPGACAATASGMVALAGLGLQLAPDAEQSDGRELAARAGRAGGRPNVLLLVGESLRADYAFGEREGREVAPALRRLAERGVRFDQCLTPVNGSVGALASLLTGVYPHSHGLQHEYPGEEERGFLRKGVPLLPERMRELGYDTYVAGDGGSGRVAGLPLGFAAQEMETGGSVQAVVSGELCRAHPLLAAWFWHPAGRWLLPELAVSAPMVSQESVTDRVCERLEERALEERPFFWTVYYSCGRMPYENSARQFAGRGGRERLARLGSDAGALMGRVAAGGGTVCEAEAGEAVRELYAGAVGRFDDCVGRVVARLKSTGQWENTIVMVAGDHGEELLEDGVSLGHGNGLQGGDRTLRVPAVLHLPGRRHAAVVPHVVRLVDFAPTLLELCGGDSDAGMEGVSLGSYLDGGADAGLVAYGESSVPFPVRKMEGESPLVVMPEEPLLTTDGSGEGRFVLNPALREKSLQMKERMIRTGRWKLVFTPGETRDIVRLFAVAGDPECREDVARRYPGTAEVLRRALWEWMRERRQRTVGELFPEGEPDPEGPAL
jgi:arylsulfatase A-like enzyme